MKNSVYCITGGSGFLGKHLISSLALDPELRIKYLSRGSKDIFPGFDNVDLYTGDLLEKDSLKGFLEPNSILINLAYLKNNNETKNLEAVDNLITHAQVCKIRKMIHCSTAVVVGRSLEENIDEMTRCKPHSDYEKTKHKIEVFLLGQNTKKVPITILRPSAIFGKHGANLKKIIEDIRSSSKITSYLRKSLYSDRSLGLVCVDNVVGSIAFLAATDKKIDGEVFIISDDEYSANKYLHVSEIIENLFNIKPLSLKLLPIPEFFYGVFFRLLGKSDISRKRSYNCQKIKKIGFEKTSLFSDELNNYVQWYKDGLR
tara:strand:+ start:673 stop:1617 length:945 start_codon:yes stop_codon:yes gene_type:complete